VTRQAQSSGEAGHQTSEVPVSEPNETSLLTGLNVSTDSTVGRWYRFVPRYASSCGKRSQRGIGVRLRSRHDACPWLGDDRELTGGGWSFAAAMQLSSLILGFLAADMGGSSCIPGQFKHGMSLISATPQHEETHRRIYAQQRISPMRIPGKRGFHVTHSPTRFLRADRAQQPTSVSW